MPASPTTATMLPRPDSAIDVASVRVDSAAARPTSGNAWASRVVVAASSDDGVPRWPTVRPVADRLVPRGRGGEWRDPELALQRRDARAVLAQRGGPIAAGDEQVHQPDVAALVERVQVQAPRCGIDGRRQVALGRCDAGEPVEDRQHRPFRGNGAARAPVVELRTVAEIESGEEGPAPQRGSRLEGRPIRGTRRGLHRPEVHPHAGRSRSTRVRSITSAPSPIAARSVESVRRRAPRAAVSSESGQSSAASSSRAYGRPSAASIARIATALRVSTTRGRSSTSTSGGPRSRIRRRGADLEGGRVIDA